MRLLFILALLLISCEQQDLCDLNYYPVPMLILMTQFTEKHMSDTYMCVLVKVDKIYTYTMSKGCWSVNTEDDYNLNCP